MYIANSVLIAAVFLITSVVIALIGWFIWQKRPSAQVRRGGKTSTQQLTLQMPLNVANQIGVFTASGANVFFRPVNTPLVPLTASLYTFTDVSDSELPNFLFYKPKLVGDVLDQGVFCGSCYAFVTADLIASGMMIATGGKFLKNLSAQQILSCVPDKKTACDGRTIEEVIMFLAESQLRLTTDREIPYLQFNSDEVTEACTRPKKGLVVNPSSIHSLVEYIPEFGYDEAVLQRNVLNIKKRLYAQGFCYASIVVYNDFMTFSGVGIYQPGPKAVPIGGHGVLIVGYCDEGVDPRPAFRPGYWICKNTFGTRWAPNLVTHGYFPLRMGVNSCGIASRVGAADAYLPRNVESWKRNMSRVRWINIDSSTWGKSQKSSVDEEGVEVDLDILQRLI